MKSVVRPDFLTEEEIDRAQILWRKLKDTGFFAAAVEREIIVPNLSRINESRDQKKDSKDLAYAVESAFVEAERAAPGYLWEFVQDTCQVCGASLGRRLRFLHMGLCDRCRKPSIH